MEYGMAIAAAIVTAALGTASAVGKFNQAKSDARGLRREAEQKMEQRKQEILKLAATQKVGYVQAGVELEGTPQAVIQDTYDTGIADVNAIKDSYQQTIKNQMTAARAELLSNLNQTGINSAKSYFSWGGSSASGLSSIASSSGSFASSGASPTTGGTGA